VVLLFSVSIIIVISSYVYTYIDRREEG